MTVLIAIASVVGLLGTLVYVVSHEDFGAPVFFAPFFVLAIIGGWIVWAAVWFSVHCQESPPNRAPEGVAVNVEMSEDRHD